jgi:hypothetical protein
VHNDGTYRIVDHPTHTKARTYRTHVAGGRHGRPGNSNHLHVVASGSPRPSTWT